MSKGMDCIKIKRLEVFARHGVLPEEQALGQKFLISVGLFLNVRQAGRTDELEHSVNYAQVAERIKKTAEDNVFQLIERLAEVIAEDILLTFPLVEKTTVEIEKPWAPLQLAVETVAVSITRGWHTLYLSIGSNLGDRQAHLDQAVEALGRNPQTRVEAVSAYRETEPVGGVEQGDFLNAAVCVRTLLSPEEFLELIGEIEQEQKRERVVHWGPRTIDLDILLYDDRILQTPELTIPHREMCKRGFVLEPMAEIAPYVRHSVTGQTMMELFALLQES